MIKKVYTADLLSHECNNTTRTNENSQLTKVAFTQSAMLVRIDTVKNNLHVHV